MTTINNMYWACFFALVLVYLGFTHAAHKRAVAQCREVGHDWQDNITGLACARCGKAVN